MHKESKMCIRDRDRSGWYRVTALQYITNSTRYPESCICAAGHTSGATLWKRKEMTLPEQGMHLDLSLIHIFPAALAMHDTLAKKGDMRLIDWAEYK